MLTLSDAIKSGKIKEFVAQEEQRGIGPADRKKLDDAIRQLARRPRLAGRTSRSASRDGSSGK